MSTELTAESTPVDILHLGTLAEDMVAYLPGCADLMIRKETQKVYRDFCEKTTALRVMVQKTLVLDTTEYTLTIPYACTIDSVYKVFMGTTIKSASRIEEGNDYTLEDGEVQKIIIEEGYTVNIKTTDDPIYLYVYCILRPEMGGEECPLWFLNKYADAITTGTLARLHGMSGKPWSDPKMAQLEAIEYTNCKSKASVDAITGQTSGSLSGTKSINSLNVEGMV
jgi:hypothetical protein